MSTWWTGCCAVLPPVYCALECCGHSDMCGGDVRAGASSLQGQHLAQTEGMAHQARSFRRYHER